MSNRLKTMYNAIQTGAKDRRAGHEAKPESYGARPNSAWWDWYMWGFDNMPFPKELIDAGYKQGV